jgi:hypothetical protein
MLQSVCMTFSSSGVGIVNSKVISEPFLVSYLLTQWNIVLIFSFSLIGLMSWNKMELSTVKIEAASSSVTSLTQPTATWQRNRKTDSTLRKTRRSQ